GQAIDFFAIRRGIQRLISAWSGSVTSISGRFTSDRFTGKRASATPRRLLSPLSARSCRGDPRSLCPTKEIGRSTWLRPSLNREASRLGDVRKRLRPFSRLFAPCRKSSCDPSCFDRESSVGFRKPSPEAGLF